MVDRKFSRASSVSKLEDFNQWLGEMKPFFKEIYIIGGNHDQILENLDQKEIQKMLSNGKYVVNQGFEYKGLKFFATPLSEKSYHGYSKNTSFQSLEFKNLTLQASRDFSCNKNRECGVDVLVTHGLCRDLVNDLKPKLHLYGHHHSSFGVNTLPGGILSICATIMDKNYKILNPPVVIDIPLPMKRLTLDRSSDITLSTPEEGKESAASNSTKQSLAISLFGDGLLKFPLYSSELLRKKKVDLRSQHQSNKVVPAVDPVS